VIKEGRCGGHQLENERRGRFRHFLEGPGDKPPLGQWVIWRSQGIDWGRHPVVLQSPHEGPPVTLAQALRSGEPLPHPCV